MDVYYIAVGAADVTNYLSGGKDKELRSILEQLVEPKHDVKLDIFTRDNPILLTDVGVRQASMGLYKDIKQRVGDGNLSADEGLEYIAGEIQMHYKALNEAKKEAEGKPLWLPRRLVSYSIFPQRGSTISDDARTTMDDELSKFGLTKFEPDIDYIQRLMDLDENAEDFFKRKRVSTADLHKLFVGDN